LGGSLLPSLRRPTSLSVEEHSEESRKDHKGSHGYEPFAINEKTFIGPKVFGLEQSKLRKPGGVKKIEWGTRRKIKAKNRRSNETGVQTSWAGGKKQKDEKGKNLFDKST